MNELKTDSWVGHYLSIIIGTIQDDNIYYLDRN